MHNNIIDSNLTKKGLFFLPLGGVGEIGANCYLYCCDDSWIMVDLGISFAKEEFPGIDILVPNIDFIDQIQDKLQSIIISHAHEDHAGAISYFVDKINCPVYATDFASNLIKRRLKEFNLSNKIQLETFKSNKVLTLKNFKISFYQTTHSIPECYAIKISTSYGDILHTADWKNDRNPIIGNGFNSKPFKNMGDEGILAIVGDSTNANTKGYSGSESEVNIHLSKLFSRYNNRIVVTCFSSNIARIQSIFTAAKKNNKKVAIVGRSLNKTIEAAQECGYLKNLDEFISQEEAKYIPKENLVIICTGSQGEKRSALYRIAYNVHRHIHLEKDDVVIFSSKDIPGNEKSINNLKNLLTRQKVEIITNEDEMVHVSGHASAEELKKMYLWTKPYLSIPVHGEALHLVEHAKIAQSCQVPLTKILYNGSLLKIAPEKPNIIDKINTGKMIVEGGNIYNSESDFVKERIKYSYNGFIMVTLLLNNDHTINKNIKITHYGLAINDIRKLTENFKLEFINHYETLNNNDKANEELIKKLSKKIIRQYCKKNYKCSPEISSHIVYV